MEYSSKLMMGTFLKRYKRFFADVELNGEVVVAHVPNTGSMKGLNVAGRPCLISPSNNPERKLKFTLEMIQAESGAWVGVNTSTPNAIVKEAIEGSIAQQDSKFPRWSEFHSVKPEFKISAATRLDFALQQEGKEHKHFIEVKNVTLAEDGIAKFPDAVSERAQKHVQELMDLVEQGHTAELVFTVQRNDCKWFSPADDIDPKYGELLRQAHKKGVVISPLVVHLSEQSAKLSNEILPLKF